MTGSIDEFTSVATREALDKATLRRRLLLCLFALGTNMGIRQMAATGEHGEHGEHEGALRRVRASRITRENLRAAIARVVNEPLAVRQVEWWGQATTTASDSKRFGSWESNLMTEFRARYGNYGVMIYWPVDKGRACIYSQLKSCSSTEVAAMIEGLHRHPRRVRGRVRLHRAAGLQAAAQAEEHRLDPALLTRGGTGRLVEAGAHHQETADQLGADRQPP
ncbi:transposase [Actinoallomurus sp. NBC_01490]|nr:Tn3 family transposase [Actinoallomurus sp. NBC_01490]